MTRIQIHMATALITCLLFLICTCCLKLKTSEASPQEGRWPGEHHWDGHRGRRMGGHRGHRGHGRRHGPPGQSRSDEYWSDEDEPPPPPPPGWGRGRGHRNRPPPHEWQSAHPPRDWRDGNRPPPEWEDRHRPPPAEWEDRHRPPPAEWGDNYDNDRATPQTPPSRFPVISPTPPPPNSEDTLITGRNPPPLPLPLPTDKPDPYWSELRNIIFPNSLEYVQKPIEVESNQLLDVRRR